MTDRPTIYLAGPMVFDPDPLTIFDRMKAICESCGVAGIAPLDGQIGLEGIPPGRDLLERIVRADIGLMERADAGVFCLDAFRRGTEMDAGTAFEVGYMKALGKPLAGWTRDVRTYPDKVAALFGGGLTGRRHVGRQPRPGRDSRPLRGLRAERHGACRDRTVRRHGCCRPGLGGRLRCGGPLGRAAARVK